MKSEDKEKIIIGAVGLSVVILFTAAAATIWYKDRQAKKKIGGRLIKVNYKYSKEFDV